jgi:hypothetical protein
MTSWFATPPEGDPEGSPEPYQLSVYLKNGECLWIVNRLDALVEVSDLLMGDTEYDGGDGTVEIRGIKLMPEPTQSILLIKPWSVAAVEMCPVTMQRCREMVERAVKRGMM